jgi:hypothetical protein
VHRAAPPAPSSFSRDYRLRRCIELLRIARDHLHGGDDRGMARIEGIDPMDTSFLMRQVFKKVRKMLGRDLTPQKIQARVPRVFWFNILGEWLLGQKARVASRQRALVVLRTAVRVGCPF